METSSTGAGATGGAQQQVRDWLRAQYSAYLTLLLESLLCHEEIGIQQPALHIAMAFVQQESQFVSRETMMVWCTHDVMFCVALGPGTRRRLSIASVHVCIRFVFVPVRVLVFPCGSS